jgi:FG-GAP repeat
MKLLGRQRQGVSRWKQAATLCMVAVLAACGGGGDDPAAGPPPSISYPVGGTLSGLGAGKTVVVAQAGGASASLTANGPYSLMLPAGSAYDLRIQTQPQDQTCMVANGTGTVAAEVRNIAVNCTDNPAAFKVSGMLTGLPTGQSVVLALDASGVVQETQASVNGRFEFGQPVAGTYSVSVKTTPPGLGCAVAAGSGTATAEVIDVQVNCSASVYRLAGSASGLMSQVTLRNAGNGESLTVGNGSFAFAQRLAYGVSYNVQVENAGAGQTCAVANATGTVTQDVGNVQLTCTPLPVTAPDTPSGLVLNYGTKSFDLRWNAVNEPFGGGLVRYHVMEDPDGAGPMPITYLRDNLLETNVVYNLPGLLHTKLNARYTIQACNSAGCSAPTAAVTLDLTQMIGYFKASNARVDSRFGEAVALSADGNTMAVGASGESSAATGVNGDQSDTSASGAGAVYIFVRTAGAWSAPTYIKPLNTGAGDSFGSAVALSADGSTLAVGAPEEDSNARTINGNHNDNSANGAGAAYVFVRNGTSWSQQAYIKPFNTDPNDGFGRTVALSGDGHTLAVGSSGEDSNATTVGGNENDNNASNSGAAYVFSRNAGAWTQQAYIKASNGAANHRLGTSVALASDGTTLAVSATGEGGSAGAAYVFTRNAGTWTEQAYVKALNAAPSNSFGSSIALAGNGNTMAVGATARANNSGAAYVFTRSGATWTQQAFLTATYPDGSDYFGNAVSLSADGNLLAVAATGESSSARGIGGDQANNLANSTGAVYLFARNAGAWTELSYLKAPNGDPFDEFGGRTRDAMALSADGRVLAVGAGAEGGNGSGSPPNQGNNSASSAGAVYLY